MNLHCILKCIRWYINLNIFDGFSKITNQFKPHFRFTNPDDRFDFTMNRQWINSFDRKLSSIYTYQPMSMLSRKYWFSNSLQASTDTAYICQINKFQVGENFFNCIVAYIVEFCRYFGVVGIFMLNFIFQFRRRSSFDAVCLWKVGEIILRELFSM